MSDVPWGICEFCGFDAHDAVRYQCKQNDETLSNEEYEKEVEFYLYTSHADFCVGDLPQRFNTPHWRNYILRLSHNEAVKLDWKYKARGIIEQIWCGDI